MSEQRPEPAEQVKDSQAEHVEHTELSERGSLTGSAMVVDSSPGENYEPPSMALEDYTTSDSGE